MSEVDDEDELDEDEEEASDHAEVHPDLPCRKKISCALNEKLQKITLGL